MDYSRYSEIYPQYREKIAVFLDKINRVKRTWEDAYTDFLNPDEQILLQKMCAGEGVYCGFFGGKGYWEKAVGVISNTEDKSDFPVDIIRIRGNFKFEKLTHRDYLGSILSLGIRREKIGDINVFEDGAEIWILNEISDYVCFNLSKIKHTGIKAEKIDWKDAREKVQNFKEMNVNVPSMRLDCMVAAAAGLSRNEASELIKSGDVKVNYNIISESSTKIKEEDMLSIKGFGRFQIISVIGTTRSQRINIAIKKFI
jgi:RNA-binding protein YlmH